MLKKTLLIVDDDPQITQSLYRLLRSQPFNILKANSGEEGLKILKEHSIDVVLSDQSMPKMTGSQFFSQVKRLYPKTIRILLTANTDVKTTLEAINEGNVYKYLIKPWDNETLTQEVKEAFQESIRQSNHDKLNNLFTQNTGGIFIFNQAGKILDVNDAFTKILKVNREEALNLTADFFKPRPCIHNLFESILPEIEQSNAWRGELFLTLNGVEYRLWATITRFYNEIDTFSQFAVLFIDVNQHTKTESHLQYNVYHDPITQIENKHYLIYKLNDFIRQSKIHLRPFALFLIGLEGINKINYVLGHTVVDDLLIKIGAQLKSILGHDCILSEFSNHEFLFLKYVDVNEEASKIARSVSEQLPKVIEVSSYKICLDFKMGVSIFPNDDKDANALIQNAQFALKNAKKLKSQTHQFYHESMTQQAKWEMYLENDLLKALDRNEMHVVYQPKRCAQTNKIHSAELLLRWNHPKEGFISPGIFIPLAEENNHIKALGYWVIKECFKALGEFQSQGHPNLELAVNISTKQLLDPDFTSNLQKLIKKYKINPSLVELEITETSCMENKMEALALLGDLKKMKFKLALDDFGTGYSSLSYLQELPIDTLKIDQSFISHIKNDSNSHSIVSSIIGMSKQLTLEVVAEGVEDEQTWNILKSLNCDYIQGYWGGKPMSKDQLLQLL